MKLMKYASLLGEVLALVDSRFGFAQSYKVTAEGDDYF